MLLLTILDSHKQFTRNSISDELSKETAIAEKEIKNGSVILLSHF